MTFPLLPLSEPVVGSLGRKVVERLDPAEFLRQLWAGITDVKTARTPDIAAASTATVESAVDLSQAVPEFAAALRERLAAAGADVSQPLVLKMDGSSSVVVDGDHPDREVAEAVFAADARLRSDFQGLAAAATRQRDQRQFWADGRFGEFRLQLDASSAVIRFE